MLCEEKGFPKRDWNYIYCYDAKELNVELERCEFCGHYPIRYVHVLKHNKWKESIHVGCECAIRLQSQYDAKYLKIKENELKISERKKIQFIKEEFWKVLYTNNHNVYYYRRYKSYCFYIWKQKQGYYTCSHIGVCGKYRDKWDGYYSEKFNDVNAAKKFLYNEYLNKIRR